MEKRLNKKIENYLSEFKDNIRDKATELGIVNENTNKLLMYIYDYERLAISQQDITKRKRLKSIIPLYERCCAKRANDERCTRRKKEGSEYCGTHIKGIPNGTMDMEDDNVNTNTMTKVEVWSQDIMGIIYYIDANYNVYQAEDILNNKVNPNIIAKYVKNEDVYSIPEFGI